MKAGKWVCWYYHTLSLPSHWSLTQQLLLTPVIILQSPAVSEFMYCTCIFLNGYKTVKNRRNSLWFTLFYFWKYCASSKLMSMLLFTKHYCCQCLASSHIGCETGFVTGKGKEWDSHRKKKSSCLFWVTPIKRVACRGHFPVA